MSDLLPSDELLPRVHPAVRNFGPDTPYDWDEEPWYRIQAANLAERTGMTEDAARQTIKGGMSGLGEWTKARDVKLNWNIAQGEDDS